MMKIGRNAPCPCGSGKKYKHCCLRKDETARAQPSGEAGFTAGPGKPRGPGDLDPEDMIMRQAGFASRAELEQAMRRYREFCEGLPANESAPTFMQFLGRGNQASDLQNLLADETQSGSFASIDEVKQFVGERAAALGARPEEDFEGLSPEQMHRILYKGVQDVSDIVSIAEEVPDDSALSAPIVETMRWIIGYLVEREGETKLTQRGNLPRAMCTRFLQKYDRHWRVGDPVPSEQSIPALYDAHSFALAIGLIEEDGRSIWIANEGARLYASGVWEATYPELVRYAIDEFDWQQWLPENWTHEHHRIVQQSALFVLRLIARHSHGTEHELFDRFARAFPAYVEPGQADEASMRFLRDSFWMMAIEGFCRPFGLVTTSLVDRDSDRPQHYRYETTALFDETFRWK